jgi:5-methylcytosine-specific restriction enzyme subunit McrC
MIEVQEHRTTELARADLEEEVASAIWSRYRQFVEVDFPSPKTNQRWRLTPKGYVGYLPLSDRWGLVLQPKLPIESLFSMLEHAYGLDSFRFLKGSFSCSSLEEFYAVLAGELAARVLRRVRQGLHRGYRERHEDLGFVRGRLDVADHVRTPWRTSIRCCVDDQDVDTEDNRLLAWALYLAARTVTGSAETRALVVRGYRALSGTVSVVECRSSSCASRVYDRLTADYAPMHALAAFVIDHAAPHHARGDVRMLPFVVDMSRLFERFVSGVLRAHVGTGRSINVQERLQPAGDAVTFVLDILVRDGNGRPIRVIDTKYKDATAPAPEDVAQVVAYATAVGAPEAVLVYPCKIHWTAQLPTVRVRALGVPLDDLAAARGRLARDLL